VEHDAVLNTCRWLGRSRYEITYLGVDPYGVVDPAALEEAITGRTFLVSIMAANEDRISPTGQRACADSPQARAALSTATATKLMGKMALDVADLGADMVTISAHKVHGPKGWAHSTWPRNKAGKPHKRRGA